MRNIIIVLPIALVLLAGIVVLQVFLSKKENKWAGLVLPIISFAVSLIPLLSVILFATTPAVVPPSVINGDYIGPIVTEKSEPVTYLLMGFVVFAYYNIPTVILLTIYAACRSKREKQLALEKMSVQDLE